MPSCPRPIDPGAVLKALFGYNGTPSLTEMLAYLQLTWPPCWPPAQRPEQAAAVTQSRRLSPAQKNSLADLPAAVFEVRTRNLGLVDRRSCRTETPTFGSSKVPTITPISPLVKVVSVTEDNCWPLAYSVSVEPLQSPRTWLVAFPR